MGFSGVATEAPRIRDGSIIRITNYTANTYDLPVFLESALARLMLSKYWNRRAVRSYTVRLVVRKRVEADAVPKAGTLGKGRPEWAGRRGGFQRERPARDVTAARAGCVRDTPHGNSGTSPTLCHGRRILRRSSRGREVQEGGAARPSGLAAPRSFLGVKADPIRPVPRPRVSPRKLLTRLCFSPVREVVRIPIGSARWGMSAPEVACVLNGVG